MTDFKDALLKGLNAHKSVVAAHDEIVEVLAKASQDIASVVGVPVTLQIQSVDEPVTVGMPLPRRKVDRLTAREPSGRWEPLAGIEFGELGYPVTLRWDGHAEYGSDREGFERALGNVLQAAGAGKAIKKLVAPVKQAS